MKTKIYLSLLIAFLTWGCQDFLEETSQDLVRPSTVNDLEQILLGDGYGSSTSFYACTDIFTDDMRSDLVHNTLYQEVYDEIKWMYIWDNRMFTDAGSGYYPCFWEEPYKKILGCNLVLDNLDEKKGEERLRESLRGETLTLRAWYYLQLVNFFGKPYNQGDPSMNLGVPLKLDASVTGEFYTRATVAEVYDQIEKDLLEGNRLLKKYNYNRNFYRIGHLAAKAMLSRLYLYKEDWDKALIYADSVLMEKGELLDLNPLQNKIKEFDAGVGTVYAVSTSNEIIWAREVDEALDYGTSGQGTGLWTMSPFYVADDLVVLYGTPTNWQITKKNFADLRSYFYFTWGLTEDAFWGDDDYPREKINKQDPSNKLMGIRTAEMYLNRAEAYIRKYLKEGNDSYRIAALADLNKLRQHRFHTNFMENVDYSGEELLNFYMEERRRELVGETNHRWCDVRRYGLTITHELNEEGTEYTKNMGQYTLPIPEQVINQNPGLIQN